MNIQAVMTKDPAFCAPNFSLHEVARLMIARDCGCIPVVDDLVNCRPIGVITDRDIICRTVAADRNPLELTAADCMSQPCISVGPDTSLDECCALFEQKQIRRIPVVDEHGACCGIVAQADLAAAAPKPRVAEVLRRVSEHTRTPSSV